MFGAACMLLLTCTQYALSLPSFSIRFCSTAWNPGLSAMVPGGRFQIVSVFSRCAGLVTTMSAGSRCENVPTSRAVPHADGWPVSENGLLPGVEILPVSRCWLKPIVQNDVTLTFGSA